MVGVEAGGAGSRQVLKSWKVVKLKGYMQQGSAQLTVSFISLLTCKLFGSKDFSSVH